MLKTPANFVFGSQEILNVPHSGKELLRQLGVGRVRMLRFRFLLVCGLVRGYFEQPYNPR